jgi:hypothetical protein
LNTVFFDSTASDDSRHRLYEGCIDFRTVHSDGALARRSAPNIDSDCAGICMGDYLRGTDLRLCSEDIIGRYDTPAHTKPEILGSVGSQWRA